MTLRRFLLNWKGVFQKKCFDLNGKVCQTTNEPRHFQTVLKTQIMLVIICPSVGTKTKFILPILLLPGRRHDNAHVSVVDEIRAPYNVSTPPVNKQPFSLEKMLQCKAFLCFSFSESAKFCGGSYISQRMLRELGKCQTVEKAGRSRVDNAHYVCEDRFKSHCFEGAFSGSVVWPLNFSGKKFLKRGSVPTFSTQAVSISALVLLTGTKRNRPLQHVSQGMTSC